MNNYIFPIPTEPLMVPHFSSIFLSIFFTSSLEIFDFLFFENHNNVYIRNTILHTIV